MWWKRSGPTQVGDQQGGGFTTSAACSAPMYQRPRADSLSFPKELRPREKRKATDDCARPSPPVEEVQRNFPFPHRLL